MMLRNSDNCSQLTCADLYSICQVLGLRAMQHEFEAETLPAQLVHSFGCHPAALFTPLIPRLLEISSTMDIAYHVRTITATTTTPFVDFWTLRGISPDLDEIITIRVPSLD